MRKTLNIVGGILLASSLAIFVGLAFGLVALAGRDSEELFFSVVLIGAVLGAGLGFFIWITGRERPWASRLLLVGGALSSLLSYPGFHRVSPLSDGWDSLRAELTFVFWLTLFSGCLCALFAGLAGLVGMRDALHSTRPNKTVNPTADRL
jgi:hypothetical protein